MSEEHLDANNYAEPSSEPAVEPQEVAPEQPEVQESSPQEPAQEQAPAQEAKEAPFHEHPRWQEIQQQLQEQRELNQRLSQRVEQLSQPKQSQEEPELIRTMREVNPDFADDYTKVRTAAERIEQLERQIEAREAQSLQEKLDSEVNRLHSENKVPAFMQKAYRSELNELASKAMREGRRLDWSDVPKLYESVHKTFSKQLDEFRAADRKEYAKAKRADSQPTPKDAPVQRSEDTSDEPPPGYDRREWRKHQIAQRVAKAFGQGQ